MLKKKLDHVGAVAKISIRREIASSNPLQDAIDMIEFVKTKFCDNTSPSYNVKEIDECKIEVLRAEMRLKKISSIKGSASFQVLRFKLICKVFSAAPYLCSYDEHFLVDYRSCDLFFNYETDIHQLREVSLRPHNAEAIQQHRQQITVA